jgi:uncharacterized protein (UPF0333 family)
MAYLGQKPATGDNNSFKILDDIKSYTLTFNPASVVSTSANTLTHKDHRFVQAQRVIYNDGGGTNIGGLTSGGAYFIIKNDENTIKFATSASNANAGTAVNLANKGAGTAHTLTVAFDGVNTKFCATYDDGTKAQMSRAAQLTLSINGVIQQPNDTKTPTNGFGYDIGSVIIFSTAPSSSHLFWGNLVANNFPSFDISDNKVDNFTGDGSTTAFTLSKSAVNNENLLVTLDGVLQYPDDAQNTRAYSVTGTNSATITFASAPGNGVAIQVRHIGFAGATSSSVTGFYGRTGNVTLKNTDDITVKDITATDLTVNDISAADITASGTIVGNIRGTVTGTAQIGIQSGGTTIGLGVTQLNFIGAGNTFALNGSGTTVDISIAGGGGASTWTTSITGIQTASAIVGVGTVTTDDADLQGIGNTARGLYISNGMMIVDNTLNGNHYIGTNFNGLMAGPVTVNGVLSVDGNYVVV